MEIWLRVNWFCKSSDFTLKQISHHIKKSDVIRQYMLPKLSTFLFYCSRYLPSLIYFTGKNNNNIDNLYVYDCGL